MYIGIDLGGSHIGVGIVALSGEIITKMDYSTDNICTGQEIVTKMCEMIKELLTQQNMNLSEIEHIGIGSPGIVTNDTIVYSNNLNLRDFNIVEEMKKYLNKEIFLKNDAKCATIAESLFGSLKGYSNSLLLTIGTGIGGGIILNDKLLIGSGFSGGEVGHTIIKKDGLKCTCGQKGCFEAYASMRSLKNRVKERLNVEKVFGRDLPELLFNRKDLSDIVEDYVDCLSTGIANIINICDPEMVVLGGSIIYYEKIFLNQINKLVNEKVYNTFKTYPVNLAILGNDAGIIGAAQKV